MQGIELKRLFAEHYSALQAAVSPPAEDVIGQLIRKAMQLRKNAYAPYSGYHVGAALLGESGRIYGGVNVENASYPNGCCGEKSAFSAAVTAGERSFIAIAICGGAESGVTEFCVPCGMCRQLMAEFCRDDFYILSAKSETEYRMYTLSQLLPEAFRLL